MSNHYPVFIPVKGSDGKDRFRRVGVMFENQRRETEETFFSIKLDFAVGATELVAFPPKDDGNVDVVEAPEAS